jgi:hypothetical protein
MTEETSQSAEPGPGDPAPVEAGLPEAGVPEAGRPEAAPAEAAPATGDPRVDAALASLESLGEVPDTEHVEAFEHVHEQLHAILDEVGEQDTPARNRGPDRR